MDSALFQKIIERRSKLTAELEELDGFLRMAEALAARLAMLERLEGQPQAPSREPEPPILTGHDSLVHSSTPPAAAEPRRWPQVDLGALSRDLNPNP